MAKPFYVYIVRCSDLSYYTGHTDDLARRMTEHETGGRCSYTTPRRPVELVWYAEFATREEAKGAERTIKRWNRAKKEALIAGDMTLLSEAARKTNWAGHRD